MSMLSVHLFGEFRVLYDNQPLSGFEVRKVQELFCYVLLHRDRSHTREMLSAMLWGDTSPSQSKANLRKTLWQLQAALNQGSQHGAPIALLMEGERVYFNSEADLWLDVRALEEAYTIARGQPGERMSHSCAEAVEHALQMYRGELLDGWYQEWCLYERERLHQMYVALLDKMMAYSLAHRNYEHGVHLAACVLRYDRAHEQTHRRLMQMLFLAGDRTAALRQYERCAAALAEELGVQPSEQTSLLYEQLRGNSLEPAPSPDAVPDHLVPREPLPALVEHLHWLSRTLSEMQGQVEQHLRSVEQLLRSQR